MLLEIPIGKGLGFRVPTSTGGPESIKKSGLRREAEVGGRQVTLEAAKS